jgi:rod shape determining protein RodA
MYEANLNERKSDFDWPLLAATGALAVVGVFFIFSASGAGAQELALYRQKFFRQIVWCLAGAGAAALFCMVDYSKVARWSRVIYWGSIASLVAVLVIGVVRKGGQRWISAGSFDLQPSEFAKLAFIFLMAEYLSRPLEELRKPRVFFTALGYTALPFLLIWKEPDLGSALVFLFICMAVMFAAGVPKRFLGWLAGLVGPLVILTVLAVLYASPRVTIVKSYQKDRLRSFFGLNEKNDAANYNVNQSLIAVGSGGIFGKGWRQGTQHELGYLPPAGAPNDFIFAVIAEEEGFAGSVVILALYSVLLFSGIKVASQARDRLGQLLAVGVVTLFFSHVFINIGMNIRLMPVTGIPLPLLSYGGSSVVCSLIAIGILHNVHIYRKSY